MSKKKSANNFDLPAPVTDIAAIALSLVLPVQGAAFSGVAVVKKLLDDKKSRRESSAIERGV
jgi:hypothetical protein